MSRIKRIWNIWNILDGKAPVIMYGSILLLLTIPILIAVYVYGINIYLIDVYIFHSILLAFGISIGLLGLWFICKCIKMELEAWPTTWENIKSAIKGGED